MIYIGKWHIDDYITFTINTHNLSTGITTDADSAPTYRIYEEETTTAIANGTLSKLDDDNTTGYYSEQIQLLSATGYEVDKCYTIYISSTVSTNVSTSSYMFTIETANNDITVANILDGVVDGTYTIETSLRAILAGIRGKISKSSNVYTYKRTDDTTTDFTHTLSSDERTVV